MRKQNRKKLVSLSLCCAVVAGMVLSPVGALAAPKTIEGTGKKQGTTATVDGDSGLETAEIPINASTKGADIIYKITVDSGAMTFSYTYGKTWNPDTHTYADGTVGWDPADLNGTNNIISVTNYSNFPVKAAFAVDDKDAIAAAFNNTPTATNAVKGYFSTSNSDFINNSGEVTNIVKTGSGGSERNSMTLEMNASNLTSGDVYYRKDSTVAKTDTTACEGDMFFALAGVPDKNIETSTAVGNIIVTITPEVDTTRVELP